MTYNAMTSEDDMFLPGTSIGSVDVSGKTRNEALSSVTDDLQSWQNGTILNLMYKEKTIQVNLDIFEIDVQESVVAAQSGQANPMIVSIPSQELKAMLQQLSSKLAIGEEELTKVNNELLSYAHLLKSGEHHIAVGKLLATDDSSVVISETILEFEEVSVAMMDWVAALSPITIPAESQFSFLKTIEENKLTSMPAANKSMIATAIYKTVLPTNFVVIQRHIGQQLPNYIELGFEAKINQKNNLDLAFTNPNKSEYTIELKWVYPTLTVQLKGSSLLYKYVVEQTGKQEFDPKTIIQYSPQLHPSQKTVKEVGRNGLLTNVIRKVYGENDEFLSEEFISEDFYAPVERIEVHGLKSSTTTGTSTGDDGAGTETTTDSASQTESVEDTTSLKDETSDGKIIYGKPNETEK